MSKLYKNCLLILFVFLSACSSKYKYWDIDQFKIDNNSLGRFEEIKLLYSSQAPEYDNDRDYYIQVVVVSQKTGDTVNILTTSNNGFEKEDGMKVFNFIPNETSTKRLTKVIRDPEYDRIADNNFPAIIGDIGTYVSNK